MGNTIVVGVAGGSGSGKTTLASRVKDYFGDRATILCHDYYYNSNRHMTFDQRKLVNYDHPDAFETDLMIRDLQKLRSGQTIERPVYSFVEYTRLEETVTVQPTDLIIVEGILIFENLQLCDIMDVKAFIDADADERLIRRLIRDINERGRSLDSVVNQYMMTVKPMHEKFVEPSKKNADIIIPKGAYNTVALQMLIEMIKTRIG